MIVVERVGTQYRECTPVDQQRRPLRAENMLLHLCSSLTGLGCQSVAGVFENLHRPHLEVAERLRDLKIPVEIIQCRGRLDWGPCAD